ncbi:MAG: hypothetical protein ACOY9Y_14050 [Bacillota bacterium]
MLGLLQGARTGCLVRVAGRSLAQGTLQLLAMIIGILPEPTTVLVTFHKKLLIG